MTPILLIIPTLLALNAPSAKVKLEEMKQLRTEKQNQIIERFSYRLTNNVFPLMNSSIFRLQDLVDRLDDLTNTAEFRTQLENLITEAERLEIYTDEIPAAENPYAKFLEFKTELETWRDSLRQLRQNIYSSTQLIKTQNE
jgi:hypothetical protein